jgi:HNH endonuclease
MTTEGCSVPKCSKKHFGNGYCRNHNYKFVKYGDPLVLNKKPSRAETTSFIENALSSETDECILWPYALLKGYGVYAGEIDGFRTTKAHIYVCSVVHGVKKEKSLQVRHLCGNRGCINPRHLLWGTAKENTEDRMLFGNSLRGESNASAKLNAEQVLEIRQRHADGESLRALGKVFGVTRVTVRYIVRRKTWKHI